MKWLTKSHELGVFLIMFVLVVDEIRGDERTRMDAAQDPYEDVVIFVNDSSPESALFGSCIDVSRTLAVQLYSIEIPGTANEFIRYVPESFQLAQPPSWVTVSSDPPVATITDCAAAAHIGGSAMFKYSGVSDCKVCNQTYDLKYTPACEAANHDAVFISSLAVAKCPLPRVHVTGISDYDACITAHNGPMSAPAGKALCSIEKDSTVFSGPVGLATFEEIVKILKNRKAEAFNFTVSVKFSDQQQWQWAGPVAAVDRALMVRDPPTSGAYVAFMSGSADFKLDFAPEATYMGGVVCFRYVFS